MSDAPSYITCEHCGDGIMRIVRRSTDVERWQLEKAPETRWQTYLCVACGGWTNLMGDYSVKPADSIND